MKLNKTTVVAAIALLVLPLGASAKELLVSLRGPGLFSKAQTYTVVLPADGTEGVVRDGLEVPYIRTNTEQRADGSSVSSSSVVQSFEGTEVKAKQSGELTTVTIFTRKVLGEVVSPTGDQRAPQASEEKTTLVFSGDKKTFMKRELGNAYSRVEFTIQ